MPTEASAIRELDEETVARIAAGEVIERPASVCKELVENSLDAEADRIDVAVANGGIDAITVRDNGIGMSETDLRLAVKEHTTSKLETAADLTTIQTLGFRGEALHTIGAVSRMTITSRPATGDAAGTRLRYVGGDIEAVDPAGRPPGTTVEVTDLFFNTPARREYLGEPSTEFRHISRVVGRYALANPDVAVTLEHDDSTVFSTTGQGDRRSAIMHVYGRDVAESMHPVDHTPEGPIDRIHGFISDPETTRASRQYLGVYVNGRYVEPDVVRSAIVEGYGGQLAADRYPIATLFLELPSDAVDVNVHPRKLAVRFSNADAVETAVESAVRETLVDAGDLRSSAPRGVSSPEETSVDLEHTGPSETPSTDSPSSTSDPSSATTKPTSAPTSSRLPDTPPAQKFSDTSQQTLDGEDTHSLELDGLPALRVLGQLADTYVVAASDTGLVLIDQHAADERIHYERLLAAFEGETEIQTLAEPVTLELTPAEAEAFDAMADALARLGFHTERSETEVLVRTVPALFGDTLAPEHLYDVLDAVLTADTDGSDRIEAIAADAIADLACAPAITGNTALTDGSIQQLLLDLDACENPYTCPHGRPTVIELETDEIAARFERDYPGHDRRE